MILIESRLSLHSSRLIFFALLLMFQGPSLVWGDIVSVQSGAWNDEATWSDRVPTADDRVVIVAGHTITIPPEGVTCRYLRSRTGETIWAAVDGRGSLTITEGSRCSYIAFSNRGGIRVPMASGGNVFFEHCTFRDQETLRIGTPLVTPTSAGITISHCDFRRVSGNGKQVNYIILIHGRQGVHRGRLLIDANTFVGINGGQGLRIQRRDGAEIIGNVFIDSSVLQLEHTGGTISSSGGHLLCGNLFAHIHDTSMKENHRVVYVIPGEQPIRIEENYIYDVHWNDHTITGGTTSGENIIRNNIFEYGPTTKEANAVSLAGVPLLVEGNILTGSATLVSNVGNHAGSHSTLVRRNIVYNTGMVVPGLFLSENGLPSYPLHFVENIVVGGRYAFFHNGNPPGRARITHSDNNRFWNVEQPYHPSIMVIGEQRHDRKATDQALADPHRGFLAYYAHITGGVISGAKAVTVEAAADAFAAMNGYDDTDGRQKSALPQYTPLQLHRWVAAGFRRKEER